jgi:putative glutamine amidotransferase
MKKRIGIAANISIVESGTFPGLYRSYVNNDYVESLEKADCIPVLLPVIGDHDDIPGQITGLDGIIFSGGYDIDPSLYNEQPLPQLGFVMKETDQYALRLVHEADKAAIPVFGICKGIQIINVAFGGTLYQDITSQIPGAILHSQKAPRYEPSHAITVEPDSFISNVLERRALVNSFHHQSVRKVAGGFTVTARSDDGVVECIERTGGTFICGVQFHPEMMAKFGNETMIRLFREFAAICK